MLLLFRTRLVLDQEALAGAVRLGVRSSSSRPELVKRGQITRRSPAVVAPHLHELEVALDQIGEAVAGETASR